MGKNRTNYGMSLSQRQLRVGELIRRTLADSLLRHEVHDPELNRLSITVGEVRMTADLKIATIYVLPLGGRAVEQALQSLEENKRELRRIINKKTSLKFSPDLRFKLDDTFDRIENTKRLFENENVLRDLER
ncbi:MAG: 30S ribosome-binding factor RbfA [Aestuariivita sp.]|nr:30S ribosome-binding factor RbfA [Aestuariivita sp.]